MLSALSVILYGVAVLVSLLLIALVLIQPSKSGGFGSAFGSVVILSLFWRRFTYKGALAGVIAGAVTDVLWLIFLSGPTGIYEIIPGFIVSMIVAVVVTLIDKAPSAEVTEIFDTATAKDCDD